MRLVIPPASSIVVTLPGGYLDQTGAVHRGVEVAPLTGGEEEFVASSQEQGAAVVTWLISRCVRGIGGVAMTEGLARQLLVADRLYLLLELGEATFGEHVHVTVLCPNTDCAAKMDVDFSTRDVPIVESEHGARVYQLTLSPLAAFAGADGEPCREIAFRLPNGGDQEALASLLAHDDEAAAAEALLARCVVSMGPAQNPGVEGVRPLSPLARMEIEAQMEAAAPQVQMIMEGACPECQGQFTAPFDIQSFFFRELRSSLRQLYREVHYLAYHYHWSEREIMEMPRQKRRHYIEVLSEEIERLNDAALR